MQRSKIYIHSIIFLPLIKTIPYFQLRKYVEGLEEVEEPKNETQKGRIKGGRIKQG
jgi:hypothetical protein